MKLSDFKKDYYEFSGLASSSCRQLSFAGIAVIWVFKKQTETDVTLPVGLLAPLFFLILALTAELLQYTFGACIWRHFFRLHEAAALPGTDTDLDAPQWPQRVISGCFFLKIFSVVAAYAALLIFSVQSIRFIQG